MITRRNVLTLTALGLAAVGATLLPFGGLLSSAAWAQGADAIQEITLGDPDAPVKVTEYASFTCPHCADFHKNTFPAFKRDYIDTGKVFFTYREVYFDRYGLWASMIARCAGPDRFFGISGIIFDELGEWARQDDPAMVAASLKRIGAQAGLSPEQADACLEDGEKAQALVSWYEANAAKDNIRSTPSFLIDGEMHSGNMSPEQIGALVDAAL